MMNEYIEIETMSPFGALITPVTEKSIFNIPPQHIENLVLEHQILLLRGFSTLTKSDFAQFAKQFGPLLKWDFGEILDIELQPNPANHIFNSGRVELHWDGAFVDENPRYNIFQCLQGCESDGGGETLFVNTIDLFHKLGEEEKVQWESTVLKYQADKKAHYGGDITEPLVSPHPISQKNRVRFIEPYNEDNAKVNPVESSIEGYNADEQENFFHRIIDQLYQEDVMYHHQWKTGDFVIVDNNALLHGRSRFINNQVTRHLQRVHVL